MRSDVNKLFEELGSLSQVEAVALGGSRATGRNDEKSDYDVYVYKQAVLLKMSEEIFWKNTADIWKSGIPFGNLKMMLH